MTPMNRPRVSNTGAADDGSVQHVERARLLDHRLHGMKECRWLPSDNLRQPLQHDHRIDGCGLHRRHLNRGHRRRRLLHRPQKRQVQLLVAQDHAHRNFAPIASGDSEDPPFRR